MWMIILVGDVEVEPADYKSGTSIDRCQVNSSLDTHDLQNNNTAVPSVTKFHRRRRCRTSRSNKRTDGRHASLSRGSDVRRKRKKMVSQHICRSCGHLFSGRQMLLTHLVTHTGERPFPCRFPGCDKRFGQSSTRNYHERIHSDVHPFVCSRCGRCFKHATLMRLHFRRMHGTGECPHHCDQCGRQFKLIRSLTTHVRTVHTQNRPYACELCPKRFKGRRCLVRHTRAIHCAEKPVHCPVCDRAFTQACNMRTHMRTHTGEKPFVCDVCGVKFSHSGSLKGHRSTHQKLIQGATVDVESMNVSDTVLFNAAESNTVSEVL